VTALEDRTVPTAVVEVEALTDAYEGGGNGGFRLTRTETSGTLSVGYMLSGSATEWDDFTPPFMAEFADGEAITYVSIEAEDDTDSEFTEGVVFTLSDTASYDIDDDSSAAIVIYDNDTPLVAVARTDDALEGVVDGQFWFSRKGDLSSSLTVGFSVGGTAIEDTDYTSIGTSVTFAADEAYAILDVEASDDNSFNPDETVIVTLQSGMDYTLDTVDAGTVTIRDAIPVVTVERVVDTWEDGREGRFHFTRTGDLTDPLTVNYTISGSATADEGYEELSGTVEFAAGESEVEVVVTPIDDTDADPDEEVTVTIDTSANYVVGTIATASMLIVDDESPIVTVTTIADAFRDGADGLIRFTRTGDTSSSLTVSYSVSGTATSGTDYTALSGSVAFAAGEATADVAVAAIVSEPGGGLDGAPGDGLGTLTASYTTAVLELNAKTVIVQVTSGTGYGREPDAIDVVYIADDAKDGEIGGVVWLDEDGDGIRDSGEDLAANYSVALLDEFGHVLYRTLTGTLGDYLFSGLVARTYFVQFYAPLLSTLTVANQGSDASVSSSANPETGRTDPITLTSGSLTNLALGVGLRAAPPPDVPDHTVILTYKDGATVGENALKVAKWHDAFEADPTEVVPFGALAKKTRVRGPIEKGLDFIDRDNDRFNVRIKDIAAWNLGTKHLTAKISTTNPADRAVYNDNETEIDLLRIPDQPGWYWSASQMLVSNAADDEYSDANVAKDEAAPDPLKPDKLKGWEFYLSDRTHTVALGGSVKAKYTYKNAQNVDVTVESAAANVKVEKVVKLNINLMKDDPAVPAKVATKADVEKDVVRMNEIYARIGVRVQAVINDKVAAPAGVSLADGLTGYAGIVEGEEVGGKKYMRVDMSREELLLTSDRALKAKDPADPTKLDASVINVYYVNNFGDQATVAEGYGTATPLFPAPSNVVMISSVDRNYGTLAHEVFHVLENIAIPKTDYDNKIDVTHYPYTMPLNKFEAIHTVNLMVTGAGTKRPVIPTVFDSVRLTEDQQARAGQNTALVKAPN
jgi:hypothetical protein